MTVRSHTGIAEFWELAGELYEADPVRHNVSLEIVKAALATGHAPDRMLTVWDGDAVAGAAVYPKGWRPLLLSAVPESAIAAVARALAEDGTAVPSVDGPTRLAEAFAREWQRLTGHDGRPGMREMLHQLGTLLLPHVPGAARRATEADLDVLTGWAVEYQREVFGVDRPEDATRAWLSQALRGARVMFSIWEDDGAPVAYAGTVQPIAGVARIAPVYVPKQLRGNGYGIAVAGAATEQALSEAGAERVVLFTDLANPTSNSIYAKLGYRPVEPFLKVVFDS